MNTINRKEFFKKSALGGLIILLPIALLAMGFRWLFGLVTDLIQPFTSLFVKYLGFPELLGDLMVLIAMTCLCFVMGWLVSTAGGAWFHSKFDERLSRYAPGYKMVREIVAQFFGDAANSPFANGEVALVRIFGADNPTEVTSIVTSRHPDGRFTVFVPTGPNPTSGQMYHCNADQVRLCPDVGVEDMMRSIIACGAGSGKLFAENLDEKPVSSAS